MYNAHSLNRLIGMWIWLPDPLLAIKWIQWLVPLIALPCKVLMNINETIADMRRYLTFPC